MDRQEKEQTIMKQLEQLMPRLSEKQQGALSWMLGHLNIVDAILDAEPPTEAEEQQLIKSALEKEDDLLLYIMRYHQLRKKQSPQAPPDDSISR